MGVARRSRQRKRGEENRTARTACHGCFQFRAGKVEVLRTAPSEESRQSAHETSTSRTTPATSSTGPTSSTAPGTTPMASSPAGSAGAPEEGAANGQVCHQTPEAAGGSRHCHWLWLFAGEHGWDGCSPGRPEDWCCRTPSWKSSGVFIALWRRRPR